MEDILHLIPEDHRGTVLFLLAVSPYLTRAYHAIANGGGVRGVIRSIWFGTNTPKEIELRVRQLEANSGSITNP